MLLSMIISQEWNNFFFFFFFLIINDRLYNLDEYVIMDKIV
jgi:hypothetical protein